MLWIGIWLSLKWGNLLLHEPKLFAWEEKLKGQIRLVVATGSSSTSTLDESCKVLVGWDFVF